MKNHNQAMLDHKGKFSSTYEGSYVVKKTFSKEALILADMDRHDFNMPTNSNAVIQYFASSATYFSTFLCKQKGKKKKKYIYIYIYIYTKRTM